MKTTTTATEDLPDTINYIFSHLRAAEIIEAHEADVSAKQDMMIGLAQMGEVETVEWRDRLDWWREETYGL